LNIIYFESPVKSFRDFLDYSAALMLKQNTFVVSPDWRVESKQRRRIGKFRGGLSLKQKKARTSLARTN